MNIALKLCLLFVEGSKSYTKMFICWHLSPHYDVLLPTRGTILGTNKYGVYENKCNFYLFIERNDSDKFGRLSHRALWMTEMLVFQSVLCGNIELGGK